MKATPGNFRAVGETTALTVTVEAWWDYTEQRAQGSENCGWSLAPGHSCPGCTLPKSAVASPLGHQRRYLITSFWQKTVRRRHKG